MLLTISTTHRPATDLGFLLYKHPDRCQSFPLAFGTAHVFYTEAGDERCTAALLLDIDPVGLVRRGKGVAELPLAQYVSDRPYVASSFLSVAISSVFGTALAGHCVPRPELAETPIPLEARIAVLPCHGGESLLLRLFEPLGYVVTVEGHVLDERYPAWGQSPYFTVTLAGTRRLSELLGHLYVLVAVLDREKHYYVGDEEVEKLLRHGGGWLATHPERGLIVDRYLLRKRRLTRPALDRLLAEAGEPEEPEGSAVPAGSAEEAERAEPLSRQRLNAVLAVLKASGARRVLDLGCGEGSLLRLLLDEPLFDQIVGMDVSTRMLEKAQDRLHWEQMPERRRARIELLQGSLVYRDARLQGFDAAAVVEVIEHLDPPRLAAFERALFGFAQPKLVVLTTPNREYNVHYEGLQEGHVRHTDHRFEWTRAEFRAWAAGAAERSGYTVRFLPVGPEDPDAGPPTQLGVFSR